MGLPMEYSGNRMSSQLPSTEEVKKMDVESLVLRLNDANLGLKKDALNFIKEQQIPGDIFLNLTLSCLKTYGLKLGPAMRILQTIDTLKKEDFKNKMGMHVAYNGDNMSARIPASKEIKTLDVDSLVLRLRDANLRLNMNVLYFLKDQEVSGEDFLELTHEDFFIHGLKLGPIKFILWAIQKINNEDGQEILQGSNNSNLSSNYNDNEDYDDNENYSDNEEIAESSESVINDNSLRGQSPDLLRQQNINPKGKLQQLCMRGKILEGDILRYVRNKEHYECKVSDIDNEWKITVTLTKDYIDYKKEDVIYLSQLERWLLNIFEFSEAPCQNTLYAKFFVIRGDEEPKSLKDLLNEND
ncbi:unnamed protein product [Rhizophagus irregularis]|uniref:Uncharacterized protein n=1 Tax=Rhizophagus irregularis TaxID=588596 RepID=A0A915YSJ8_9GLOM|nr:unnamed protein product [Rhizophagus irregularis]